MANKWDEEYGEYGDFQQVKDDDNTGNLI